MYQTEFGLQWQPASSWHFCPPAAPPQSLLIQDGWKQITLEFKNGPLGATYRLYGVVNGQCGKTYFDDVSIMMAGSPTDALFDGFNLDESREK